MKLPDIFVSPIDKDIDNVQKEFQGSLKERATSKNIPLMNKINNIFAAKDFVYKSRVRISFLDGNKEYIIVGKTSDALLTLDGQRIKINDILDIEIIK